MENKNKTIRLLNAAMALVIALGACAVMPGCVNRPLEDNMDSGYKVKKLTLGGVDASEYTVVYSEDSADNDTTANMVADLVKFPPYRTAAPKQRCQSTA